MVAALAAEPGRSVLALDFDGSLAPIVERPEAARPLPDVPAVLGRLVRGLGRVAVVSGRPAAFLAAHLGGTGVELIGGYGAERIIDGRVRLDPRVAPWADALAEATRAAGARLPGRLVEAKPGIGVALHWRPTPEREGEVRITATEIAARLGLRVLEARQALELRPPVPIDKGTTVREIVSGTAAACFAGDDEGDLPAFAAVREAVAAGETLRGVCVGVASGEAPVGLAAVVDLVVDGPDGLLALLVRVAHEVA